MSSIFSEMVKGFTKEEIIYIEKTLNILRPYTFFGNVEKMSYGNLVGLFDVYDETTRHLLLSKSSPEELNTILLTTADVVVEFVGSSGKIDYEKDKNRIIDEVYDRIPGLMGYILHETRQTTEKTEMSNRISSLKFKIKKSISPYMTEGEILFTKSKIDKSFSDLGSEIKNSFILDDSRKNDLMQEVEEAKKFCFDHLERRIEMGPTKLYYYKTSSGRVAVKLRLGRSVCRYPSGRGREVRSNDGEDFSEYQRIISASFIEELLKHNNINNNELWVDPRSLTQFYMFEHETSASLTPSFVKKWWERECPRLYRCTVNKEVGHVVFDGLFSHSYKILVTTVRGDICINENITEEEFLALTKGYEHTEIYSEMKRVVEEKKRESGEVSGTKISV